MTTRLTDLSRTVSHALRHEPWLYELELDDEGWVEVTDLLAALHQEQRWSTITISDLEQMIATASKQRHELSHGRIRARYGHSTPQRIHHEPSIPPATLFHGTSRQSHDAIRRYGLRLMGRQFVHLSTDQHTAHAVGSRKDSHPIILTIDATLAHTAGIRFFHGNDQVWLSESIPPHFIHHP